MLRKIIFHLLILYMSTSCSRNEIRLLYEGKSMVPTFQPGESLFVRTKVKQFDVGDIIVFQIPGSNTRDPFSVSRVVAIAGDTVRLKSGDIYINGILMDGFVRGECATSGKYIFKSRKVKVPVIEKQVVVVPEGHVFVLGDNPAHSFDSRYWGALSTKEILGKVVTEEGGSQSSHSSITTNENRENRVDEWSRESLESARI